MYMFPLILKCLRACSKEAIQQILSYNNWLCVFVFSHKYCIHPIDIQHAHTYIHIHTHTCCEKFACGWKFYLRLNQFRISLASHRMLFGWYRYFWCPIVSYMLSWLLRVCVCVRACMRLCNCSYCYLMWANSNIMCVCVTFWVEEMSFQTTTSISFSIL